MSEEGYSKIYHAYVRKGFLKLLGPSASSVYTALLSYTDGSFKDVWPSNKTLASHTGLGVSTVRKGVVDLEKQKIIERIPRNGKVTGQKTNIITFNPPDTWGAGGVLPTEQGPCSDDSAVPAVPVAPNKNNLKRIRTTTIVEELPDNDLEESVVAILKQLGVDKSFWPNLNGMGTNRVQALAKLAEKKANKNPGGWFRKAVEGKWSIPGFDQSAFEIECDLIRKTVTHMQSKKTGKEYEIDKFQTGAKIVIHTDDRGDVILDSDEALSKFTRVA